MRRCYPRDGFDAMLFLPGQTLVAYLSHKSHCSPFIYGEEKQWNWITWIYICQAIGEREKERAEEDEFKLGKRELPNCITYPSGKLDNLTLSEAPLWAAIALPPPSFPDIFPRRKRMDKNNKCCITQEEQLVLYYSCVEILIPSANNAETERETETVEKAGVSEWACKIIEWYARAIIWGEPGKLNGKEERNSRGFTKHRNEKISHDFLSFAPAILHSETAHSFPPRPTTTAAS